MSRAAAGAPGASAKDAGPHRYLLSDWLPDLLRRTAAKAPPGIVVDLGAADGAMIWALERGGLVGERGYAVDLSEERVALCASLSPRFTGIVADACDVRELPDGCADGVVSNQLIEHLPDDRRLAPEIARLLRPGGWFYVSSVLKGPHGWWIYRRDGRWLVDPTHVREYERAEDFLGALAHPALRIDESRTSPMRFSVLDLAVRAVAFAGLLPFDRIPRLLLGAPALVERAREVRVPVPGYRWIEATGTKAPE